MLGIKDQGLDDDGQDLPACDGFADIDVITAEGLDTVEANLRLGFPSDGRHYDICADIMRQCGFTKVILMTNNPAKIDDLKRHGIEVIAREALEYGRNPYNENYLNTKESKMGHLLHHQD